MANPFGKRYTFFLDDDAKRIVQQVRTAERTPRGRAAQPRGPRIAAAGLVMVQTTSAFVGRSGTTFEAGTGVLVSIGSSYAFSAGSASITLLNYTGTSIASGKYGFAIPVSTPDHGQCYVLVSVEC